MLEKSEDLELKKTKLNYRVNILGKKLETCSLKPLTGYFRDGSCFSNLSDRANHSVCAQVSTEFLNFSRKAGNDLITPSPRYGFPGLKPGDYWCLCASRWKEAANMGIKLPVNINATHQRALEVVKINQLRD